jgi:hypothetical protein
MPYAWVPSCSTAMEELVPRPSDAHVTIGDYFAGKNHTIALRSYCNRSVLFLPAVNHAAAVKTICPSKRGVMSRYRSRINKSANEKFASKAQTAGRRGDEFEAL